jgi:hypothetical protein
MPAPVIGAVLLGAIRTLASGTASLAASQSGKTAARVLASQVIKKGLANALTSVKNKGMKGQVTVTSLINQQVYENNKRILKKYTQEFIITIFAKGMYPNGKKVSKIVMYQNKGTRRHIARPFLIDIMKERTPVWRRELVLANIQSKSKASLIGNYIGVAKKMVVSVVHKIDTNTYPLNSRGKRPLTRSGLMRRSFDFKVVSGDRNEDIARILEFQEMLIKHARKAAGTMRLSSLKIQGE